MKAHVSEKKKIEMKKLKESISKSSVIGILDITNLPSAQFQQMRKNLPDVNMRISKKRIIRIALDELKDSKKGIELLIPTLENCMPALLLSEENPFRIASILAKNKTSAPAKAGQIAPNDLVIPAGPTPFGPGPIIGELGQAGIKTAIEDGKIVVQEDAVVAKKGDEISQKISDLLSKFGIEPMEIGLNIIAIFENGLVYSSDVLSVDEEEYKNNILLGHQEAFSLALGVGYLTEDTVPVLIKKAYKEAKCLSEGAGILTEETVKPLVSKGVSEANLLKSKLNIPEESKDQVKEEVKSEEKDSEKKTTPNEGLASYSEEDSEKAQEVIKKMKDNNIGGN